MLTTMVQAVIVIVGTTAIEACLCAVLEDVLGSGQPSEAGEEDEDGRETHGGSA